MDTFKILKESVDGAETVVLRKHIDAMKSLLTKMNQTNIAFKYNTRKIIKMKKFTQEDLNVFAEDKRDFTVYMVFSLCFAIALPLALHYLFNFIVFKMSVWASKPTRPPKIERGRFSKKIKVIKTERAVVDDTAMNVLLFFRYIASISLLFPMFVELCESHISDDILAWMRWPPQIDEDGYEKRDGDILRMNDLVFYTTAATKYEDYERKVKKFSDLWTADNANSQIYFDAEEILRKMLSLLQINLLQYEDVTKELCYRCFSWLCSFSFSSVSLLCFCVFIIKAKLPETNCTVKTVVLLSYILLYGILLVSAYDCILIPALKELIHRDSDTMVDYFVS